MYTAGHQFLTIINAIFEGGVKKFTEEGGRALPFPDDDGALFYHPNMTAELTEKLMQYNTRDYKIEIVSTLNEFNVLDLNNFVFRLYQVHQNCTIDYFSLAVYITFDVPYSDELFKATRELIRTTLHDVVRAFINFTDRYSLIHNEKKIAKIMPDNSMLSSLNNLTRSSAMSLVKDFSKPTASETEGIPTRDISILPDEITDMKIELGMCRDVLEFIDKM